MYGHPVLRQPVADVEQPKTPEEKAKFKELIDNMFETMYHSEGVGLAAPQIGLDIALVVIDGSPVAETFPECADSKMVIINPDIEVLEGPAEKRPEGCLSLPGISEDVRRIEHIRMTWDDENFVEHTAEFTGFLARIIQHECDHLDGTVFIDHINPIRKQFIRKKLANIVEGRIRVEYPARFAPAHK